jgi:hypothetical protein
MSPHHLVFGSAVVNRRPIRSGAAFSPTTVVSSLEFSSLHQPVHPLR